MEDQKKNPQQEKQQMEDEYLVDVTGSEVEVPLPVRKSVVQRCFHRKTHSGNKNKRVTIFYEYDRDNKILKYGAVVVIRDKTTKKKDIKDFENSAKKRFMRAPVVVRNFKDTGDMQDMHDQIRKLLFTHGCKSKN